MTTVTVWTGREANALREALRMSVTDFAAHLGAARRTVVNWSSRGAGIRLRPDMQSALDTVLARAPAEVQERFDRLCSADVESVRVPGVSAADDPGREGVVRRRKMLTVLGGAVAAPALHRLLDVLVSPGSGMGAAVTAPADRLIRQVATAKIDYQACRYTQVLDRLVTLLPSIDRARSHAGADERATLDVAATDLYHVVGSVLLKFGDSAMALVAAERSTRSALASQDPVAAGTSARIMTHALMSNGYAGRAVRLAQTTADAVERDTRLGTADAVAVYGSLVLRGAIAAACTDDRDAASAMLDEASRAATRLGHDGNDRWTGFGPTNVMLHRVNVALTLGDAGTAITLARQVPLHKVTLAERKASLFVDVAQAYIRWGRHRQGLSALRDAHRVAPEEVGSRPAVHRIVQDLAALSSGRLRTEIDDFATSAGIRGD